MMAAVQGAGGLFPLPMIEPPHATSSRSRRVQQRARRVHAQTELANSALRALNCLHASFASHTYSQTRNPTDHTYPAFVLRAVAHVQSCAERFVSRLAPCSTDSSDDWLVSRDPSGLTSPAYASPTESLPLSADLVSLPAEPGSARLLDILPPDIARTYAQPNPDLFRPLGERLTAPYVCRVRSPRDYIRLVQRLHSLGMVSFTTEPKVVNGCFATAKSDGSQRFVFDGRPVNAVFVPCPDVELPSPELLAKLVAPGDEPVYVAKADLDNFYHRLRLPEWMEPYFALPPVKASDVGVGATFGDATLVHPCCVTLPMGWSHSVFVAQKGHEHIVDTHTSLRAEDRITSDSDYRLDRPRHGIYIDDMFMLALRRHLADLDDRLDEYLRVMPTQKLPPKPSKTTRPSADGVDCIGMEVHGRDMTVGPEPQKVDRLVRRTRMLLHQGRSSGLLLSKIVGHWSWYFLARRAAFAVFNNVYRYIEVAGAKVFDIWPTVANELNIACDLAPLLFSSMSADWFPRTVASDASSHGMGVVASAARPALLEVMSQCKPPADEPLDRSLPPTLQGLRWSTIVSSPFRYREHINVLELRALTTAMRWVSSFPDTIGCRVVMWCDSLVVVFAVRQGRSSSAELLRRMRALSAHLLATGIQLYCNWIPTEVNPADGPSRRFKFDSTLGFPGEGPARGRHDFLVQAAYAKATVKKYNKAVDDFVAWMDAQGEDPETTEDMDEVLTEYFHDLFVLRGGKCRSTAAATLAGVGMRCPHMKRRLTSASLALKGWQRLVPSVPYPPLTWDLAVCVGVHMASRTHLSLGLATVLAFDCYLRVGELVALRRCDVADTGDVRMGSAYHGMSLRLAQTKTGTNQWVTVRNRDVIAMMRCLIKGMPTSSTRRLFPVSASTYRKHFKASCADLGLSPDYVPHSLRHGGATHDHITGVALEEILRHGRWAAVKSARHYVQSGRALLLTTSIPEEVAALARTLSGNVLASFTLSQKH
jgi:hypothetical protein